MAIIADETGMTSAENKPNKDSSHEFNLYADRNLQNKLIQADENLDVENYESQLSSQGSNVKIAGKTVKADPRAIEIIGWFPDAKFSARNSKLDGASKTEKSKEFIHPWRDYKSRKEENFNFKHYKDRRHYIEQYRNEHGCHATRYPSGGDVRRMAFQNSAPPQPTQQQLQQQQQQAVQVSIHQLQQGWNTTSHNPGPSPNSLHYTNRKEQMGTLIATTNCSCGKNNSPNHTHIDVSSQQHKYKMSPGTTSTYARTVTDIRSLHGDSDNSSESGDMSQTRSPIRRISSATSRGRPMSKSPTKITVPASPNQRAYPIQALTIQQQNRTEVTQATKPLDNLNIVAPEKQGIAVERKPVEPIGLALKVKSLNDLLTANDAPLRGYALPKSTPPQPNTSTNDTSPTTPAESFDVEEAVSLDQLSTVPLSADREIKSNFNPESSQVLQMLFHDPVLSRLNQKPPVNGVYNSSNNDTGYNVPQGTPKLFSADGFLIPQNDVDAMLRVNMWNPVVSTPPRNREFNNQQYRTMMNQAPFRKSGEMKSKTVQMDFPDKHSTTKDNRQDYFNPAKNVKISITRLNNAVSFVRTHIPTGKEETKSKKLGAQSKRTHSITSLKSREENALLQNRTESKATEQFLAQAKQHYDPLSKSVQFEPKINIPLPQVRVLEHAPTSFLPSKPSSGGSFRGLELPQVERKNSAGKEKESRNCHSAKFSNISNVTKTLSEVSHNVTINIDQVKIFEKDKVPNDEITEKNVEADLSKEKVQEVKVAVKGPLNEKDGVFTILRGVKIKVDADKINRPLNGAVGESKKTSEKEPNGKQSSQTGEKEPNGKQSSQKKVKKPAIASGKLLKSHQELDGLTWAEKLQLLRSVNKPPEKPKVKPQKLKFVKDEPDSVFIWSTEQEQLYEQRRIKHLVEQARVKGGKQYDWVYEAQVRARGIDWETGKLKTENVPNTGIVSSSDSSQSDETVVGGGEERKLGKYGIYVPAKGAKQKLFNVHNIHRSNTYIAP